MRRSNKMKKKHFYDAFSLAQRRLKYSSISNITYIYNSKCFEGRFARLQGVHKSNLFIMAEKSPGRYLKYHFGAV